jgi:hypothetical protein
MKRTFALILVVLVAALFVGLVHGVLMATNLSESALWLCAGSQGVSAWRYRDSDPSWPWLEG